MKSKVLCFQDTKESLSEIRITLHRGPKEDPRELAGLSYFLTRSLMTQTKKHSASEFSVLLESLGASLNVQVTQAWTEIQIKVLSDRLQALFSLLSEAFQNPLFDESAIDRLRKTILGQKKTLWSEPRNLASMGVLFTLFEKSALQESLLGSERTLERITPQILKEAFQRKVCPTQLSLALVSPWSEKKVEGEWSKVLSSLQGETFESSSWPEMSFKGKTAVMVPREGLSTVPYFVASPGVSDAHLEKGLLEIGNFVFGAEFTSKLSRVLRGENGWTYGAYSGFHQLMSPQPEKTPFSIYVYPGVQYFDQALPRTLELWGEYCEQGISDKEFESARQSLTRRVPFDWDTSEKRLSQSLREFRTGRKVKSVSDYQAWMKKVDRAQVNQAVRSHLDPEKWLICAVGEEKRLRTVFEKIKGVDEVRTLTLKP